MSNTNPAELIAATCTFVQDQLNGAEAGHDWFHIQRVWKNAKIIASTENCDMLVVQLAALLHDIADPKFHQGDEELALKVSRDFLESQNVAEETIAQVLFIIKHISFKNRNELPEKLPAELQIV